MYQQTAKKEHANILRRRQIIEDRKEELEFINTQRVRCPHGPLVFFNICVVTDPISENFSVTLGS